MLKKISIILWILIVLILIFNVIGNANIPLGFDHGPYKYFISLYDNHDGNMHELSQTLQRQFEPFSGTFLSYLHTAIPDIFLFSWLYLGAHIFISIIFFIIAKNKNKYSLGAFLGIFLFIASSVQYGNYSGSLGKQIFATIFLLLTIHYNKKLILSSIFLLACIALHRLTGFIALLFSFFSLLPLKKNIFSSKNIAFGSVIFLSLITYIPTFKFQVLPYLVSLTIDINENIFIQGRYGAGFSAGNFWFLEIPLVILSFLGFTYHHKKHYPDLFKNPYILTIGVITFLIIFRGIAHSRFQSFFDLFLILIFVKYTYVYLSKKWIYIILFSQLFLWSGTYSHDHLSPIDYDENKIIQKIVSDIPDNARLFSLSSGYRALMTGHGYRDFRDEYRNYMNIKTKNDAIQISKNKTFLCHTLSRVSGDVFLYRGVRDKTISSIDNPCLRVIKKWSNGAQLFHYSNI